MQLGFYFDQTRCLGCYSCVSACRSSHYLEPQIPDLITLRSLEKGKFPDVELHMLFFTCFHCEQPICVSACPNGVFAKRDEDGVVVITNPEECTGCELCVDACLYSAPKIVTDAKTGGIISIHKCDLCLNKRTEGLEVSCVAACPVEALAVAPMEDLEKKHGKCMEAEGYPDYQKTRPSLVLACTNIK